MPPLTEALGDTTRIAREQLPPYWALFARREIRWTAVGVFSGVFAGTAFFLISTLLPKALVDQGLGVGLGFGLTSLVYVASIFGKGFTGFLMEIIGRRWTIFYALAGSLPRPRDRRQPGHEGLAEISRPSRQKHLHCLLPDLPAFRRAIRRQAGPFVVIE